jgi:molecular chaperone DnaK (HSP70)
MERLRKLLSQLPEAKVTIEHLQEDTDVTLALKRDEFAALADSLLGRLKELLHTALFVQADTSRVGMDTSREGTQNQEEAVFPGSQLAAVEVLGGGARMPIVQQALHAVCGAQVAAFGFKLDDAAVALGAALLCVKYHAALPPITPTVAATTTTAEQTAEQTACETEFEMEVEASLPTVGLTPQELAAACEAEQAMQAQDGELMLMMRLRNTMEAHILDLRGAPSSKHGGSIDRAALSAVLDEYENWLWDAGADMSLTAAAFQEKQQQLVQATSSLCVAYFAAVAEEKAAVEKDLELVRNTLLLVIRCVGLYCRQPDLGCVVFSLLLILNIVF